MPGKKPFLTYLPFVSSSSSKSFSNTKEKEEKAGRPPRYPAQPDIHAGLYTSVLAASFNVQICVPVLLECIIVVCLILDLVSS